MNGKLFFYKTFASEICNCVSIVFIGARLHYKISLLLTAIKKKVEDLIFTRS